MIYTLYETQRAMLEPMRMMAQGLRGAFNHPFTPPALSPFAKTFDAGAELIEDVLRRRGKPDWEIRDCEIDGETWPVTIEPAVRSPFGDLLHFRRAGAEIAPKVAE